MSAPITRKALVGRGDGAVLLGRLGSGGGHPLVGEEGAARKRLRIFVSHRRRAVLCGVCAVAVIAVVTIVISTKDESPKRTVAPHAPVGSTTNALNRPGSGASGPAPGASRRSQYRGGMSDERERPLASGELDSLPETRVWPPGTVLVSEQAAGTWDGIGYDNFDPSATLSRYFEGPQSYAEVLEWYRRHLASLGWPPDRLLTNPTDPTLWHEWTRGLESIDLIDRVIGPDDPIAKIRPEWRGQRLASELPPGHSIWSVTYRRSPPP